MNPSYSTHVTDVLARYALDADKLAAKAASWLDKLATAEAEAATAEKTFLADFAPDNAAAYAEAKHRIHNLKAVVDAVTNAGGPDEARARTLRTDAVFSAFEKGFNDRVTDLTKLVPSARKKLGERKAALTEIGVNFAEIETERGVCALRDHVDALTSHIAGATFGARYSAARGGTHTPKSFDALYSELTQPFPTPPTIPAA